MSAPPLASSSAPISSTSAVQPDPPDVCDFYFSQFYNNLPRMSGRCLTVESSEKEDSAKKDNVVDTLGKFLTDDEKKYFTENKQFMHLWHLQHQRYHKYLIMLMLIQRSIEIKGEVCWFVVNGVPIRFSIKEFALLSGLNCKKLPYNYEKVFLGSEKFIMRHFGEFNKDGVYNEKDYEKAIQKARQNATISAVQEKVEIVAENQIAQDSLKMVEKLKTMQLFEDFPQDRVKMAVLLFLAKTVAAAKRWNHISDFLKHMVDDLDVCAAFPWGTHCFNKNLAALV